MKFHIDQIISFGLNVNMKERLIHIRKFQIISTGKSILPVELIRKIQPNNNNPCISYEISSGKITEYQSVGVMNNTLNMNLYRNTKGRNNHFSIDEKYLVFFQI